MSLLIGLLMLLPVHGAAAPADAPNASALIQLAHPKLNNEADVQAFIAHCKTVVARAAGENDPAWRTAGQLAQLFIWFAGPTNAKIPGKGQRLDLRSLNSPVLQRLEEDLGLTRPTGLVFLRTYPSIDAMPGPIRSAFMRQPNTRAVTFLSRYIALVADATLAPEAKNRHDLQVLEHELVHVVVNCHLGVYAHECPLWFHEGCAVYFSGQPGSQLVGALMDTDTGVHMVTYQWQLPGDYAEYRRVFRYLEYHLGEADFLQALRTVFETRSVDTLLAEVNARDYAHLCQRANRWQGRRENLLWGLVCLVLVALVIYVWRLLPRYRKPPPELV